MKIEFSFVDKADILLTKLIIRGRGVKNYRTIEVRVGLRSINIVYRRWQFCFKCDRCGLCCQNLSKSSLYGDLNDGTGVCRYFDRKSNLCKLQEQVDYTIYQQIMEIID